MGKVNFVLIPASLDAEGSMTLLLCDSDRIIIIEQPTCKKVYHVSMKLYFLCQTLLNWFVDACILVVEFVHIILKRI